MTYNWEMKEWPAFRFEEALIAPEIEAFRAVHASVEPAYRQIAGSGDEADELTAEAMRTSAVEGERLDESAVLSSVCRHLGLPARASEAGIRPDARAEGIAALVMDIRRDRGEPITKDLLRFWHRDLMRAQPDAGKFRSHDDPMLIVRRTAYGDYDVRFKAPPSDRVEAELDRFVETARAWRPSSDVLTNAVLKAALLHPYFESIHPFEDGNGRIGRALLAKGLAESFGAPIVVPVSPIIAAQRRDYYEALHVASLTLDWTPWTQFILPLLTEAMRAYVANIDFVLQKRAYLSRWESQISPRSLAVLKRMFRDGAEGVARGLSAAKYQRMAGVSKATATRELSTLVQMGAIRSEGAARATHYTVEFNK